MGLANRGRDGRHLGAGADRLADEDGKRLARLARQKATVEDAIGAEILIAREPAHFNLRNDAALIYMEMQQPQRALEHFAAARRLKPDAPSTAFNVGIALEALGRLDAAVAAYGDAIAIDATYVPGTASPRCRSLSPGRLVPMPSSTIEYALHLTPRNAGARCELARLLVETGEHRARRRNTRPRSRSSREMLPCLINFTWLLAAHEDAAIRSTRRPSSSANVPSSESRTSTPKHSRSMLSPRHTQPPDGSRAPSKPFAERSPCFPMIGSETRRNIDCRSTGVACRFG